MHGCCTSRGNFAIRSWFSCPSNFSHLTSCPWSALTLLEQFYCHVKGTTGVWNVIFMLYWGTWFSGRIGDGWTRWSLQSFPTLMILWLCDSVISILKLWKTSKAFFFLTDFLTYWEHHSFKHFSSKPLELDVAFFFMWSDCFYDIKIVNSSFLFLKKICSKVSSSELLIQEKKLLIVCHFNCITFLLL